MKTKLIAAGVAGGVLLLGALSSIQMITPGYVGIKVL